MRKIFVHCFLNESQKKYLKKNFFVKIHNANNKILTSKELLENASGYDGIICQGNSISNEYIRKNRNILKVISNVSVIVYLRRVSESIAKREAAPLVADGSKPVTCGSICWA